MILQAALEKPSKSSFRILNKLGENVKITLAEHLWLTWNSREQIFRMEFQDNLLGSGRTMRGREIDETDRYESHCGRFLRGSVFKRRKRCIFYPVLSGRGRDKSNS